MAIGSTSTSNPASSFTGPGQATGTKLCDALIAAGLADQMLLPDDAAYEPRISSWWSASARLRPWCIVQPRTTDDVSKAVRALASLGETEGAFAVRSGGHSHWAGGSSIDNGVTIDLAHFNAATYDADAGTASLGPAQRWGDVFAALEAHGVGVAGGRDGGVGVGGFMTGGGNSYCTGRRGFACDGLVNAEVVLADGRVVSANARENADLWRALKGGSGNFGIVTRFDVEAFPAGQLWGGIRASARSHTPEIIRALVNFTDSNHGCPEAAFIVNFTYQPTMSPDVLVAHVLVDTNGVENTPIFSEVQQVPELFSDLRTRSMSAMANAYVLPASKRNVWFTLTFENDTRVVQKAADLHEALLADLLTVVPPKDLVTQSLFQPVPRFFADIGVRKGGNVLGLDAVKGNSLLWLCAIAVETPELEAVVRRKASAMTAELEAYAESIGALVPWQYLNYADPSQDPLKSYGAENLEFLRAVSKKYDPAGVFQTQVPGGFKLSRTE